MTYRLHHAPDNASLCVRLALEHLELPYETVLLDRSAEAQKSPEYLRINPNGLIPALETPNGPLFETAAILLWLADRHGRLAPAPKDPLRGAFLKWLFNLSNTLHPLLRLLFYPDRYVAGQEAQADLTTRTRRNIAAQIDILNRAAATEPVWRDTSMLHFYLCPMLRWLPIYPKNQPEWFKLSRWPALDALARHVETLPAGRRAAEAEGLGATPFSDPSDAIPPEGSPT